MKKLSGVVGAVLLALLGLTSPGKSQQVVRQGTNPWLVGGTVSIGGTLPAFATTPSFICASGCTPATPVADGTAFVPGTTAFALNGGFFQTTATANPLANLQSGAYQMTATRSVFINLRNAAATEVGTAAAPLRTDPTGTTPQPVSGTVTLGGTLPAFASTPTFNCGTGCGGGGGAAGIADETAFVAGTTLQMPVGGFYQSTVTANALTNGQSGAAQLTINRAFHINLRNASGVELGVAAAPVRTDPTGTTVQPMSAVSLPLPGGASTQAKQAQFTAAGTPSTTDVYTIQGCATCTSQNVAITGTLPAYASTPAFTISGLLPAFAAPPAVTITGTLPAFASTPAVTISGTPAVTISGSLPGYASTPTFNLGSLNGAATAAKQPALGTAGVGSPDVLSVQGVIGGTPQVISATTLPLPTGAASLAKQPALGTAGFPSADVITVQGISSGTPQPITATSLPLPAGAALDSSLTTLHNDMVTLNTTAGAPATLAPQSATVPIGGGGICDGANGGTNPCVTAATVLTSNTAPAAANKSLSVSVNPLSMMQGASVPINVSTITTTQLVALSAGAKIYVTSYDVIAGGTGNITFVYGTGTACATGTTSLTGAYNLTAQAGISKGSGSGAILFVPAGNALCVTTTAAVQMSGSVSYMQF